jgi:hypothetical protein
MITTRTRTGVPALSVLAQISASRPTETPMTNHPLAGPQPAPTSTETWCCVSDVPMRSTAVHLLHEDLARAQIRERVRKSKFERQAAQLARARRLSRKEQRVAIRARLLRARFS